MNSDNRVAQIAEQVRDEETEAAHGGTGIDKPFFVYDADTWDADCADFLVSSDKVVNDRIREDLMLALQKIKYLDGNESLSLNMIYMRGLSSAAVRIGYRVIENAVASGLTLENVGEYTE